MKTLRLRKPEAVDLIQSYLLPDNDLDLEDFVAELKHGLANNGDNIYFLQTWDLENEELLAFMIAVNYPRQKHVFVYQVWRNTQKTPDALMDNYLHRLVLWTENFGKSKLKMETKRDAEAFSRRWNFKPVSTIMEFQIPENYELKIFDEEASHNTLIGKEESNGRKIENILEESPERGTAADSAGPDGSVSAGPVQQLPGKWAAGKTSPAGKRSQLKHPRSADVQSD